MKVVSLELAKELKKAEFPQNLARHEYIKRSEYENRKNPDYEKHTKLFPHIEISKRRLMRINKRTPALEIRGKSMGTIASAPTADEILDLLPHAILIYKYRIVSLEKETTFGYRIIYTIENIEPIDGNTLPNVTAKMWLYLKENDLLK